MKGGDRFSRIVSLSYSAILLLSPVEITEQEPVGLHLDSDGKRILLSESDGDPYHLRPPGSDPVMFRNHFTGGAGIATIEILPGLSRHRSGPVIPGSFSRDAAGPESSIILRV